MDISIVLVSCTRWGSRVSLVLDQFRWLLIRFILFYLARVCCKWKGGAWVDRGDRVRAGVVSGAVRPSSGRVVLAGVPGHPVPSGARLRAREAVLGVRALRRRR